MRKNELNLNEERDEENIFELDEIKEEIENFDSSIDLDETIEEEPLDPFDLKFSESINKHKIEGVHRLSKDVIFNPDLSTDETYDMCDDSNDDSNDEWGDSNQNYTEIHSYIHGTDQEFEGFVTNVELSNDVYELLSTKTKIDLCSNRRKPNKITFNSYYELLTSELQNKYSKAEIFVELTHYFTDNLFNGFKLLEKKHATGIILEMKNKGYLREIGDINFV